MSLYLQEEFFWLWNLILNILIDLKFWITFRDPSTIKLPDN